MTTTTRMIATPTGWSVTIPAGTYFLGDPCYAVPDGKWHDLLESCDYFEGNPVGVFTVPTLADADADVQVLAFGTAYGDGEYTDQFGHKYAVDAGLIGLTPVRPFLRLRYTNNELEALGQLVTFDGPVTATTDGNGRLTFGHYEIDTTDESDDDYDGGWGVR